MTSFKVAASENFLFVFVSSSIRDEINLMHLYSLDKMLNLVNDFDLEEVETFTMATHEDNLYVYIESFSDDTDLQPENIYLAKYNSQLEIVERIGQPDPNLPFCFPFDIGELLINEKIIIINSGISPNFEKETLFIKRQTGVIEKRLDDFNSFEFWSLYLNKYIIDFKSDGQLCTLNLKGELIHQIKLPQSFDKLTFAGAFNKHLYFVETNPQEAKIYCI